MIRIPLTQAQRAAVLTYIVEEVHREDYSEAHLSGGVTTGVLELCCGAARAAEILIEAANSADESGDHGSCKALSRVLGKMRRDEVPAP